MVEGLTYLYQCYSAFLDLLFNQFNLFSNVSIGWVIISLIVMSLIVNSVLNIPKMSKGSK